jgi:hypothetical protein
MNKMSRSEAGKLGWAKAKNSLIERHERFVNEYQSQPKLCKFCKSQISYDKRLNDFCSRSCSASYNNLGIKRNYASGEYCERPCLNCGTLTRQMCCSHECSQKRKYNLFIEEWLNGNVSGVVSMNGVSNYIRRWLIEQRGEKCELCGWCEIHPITGKVPVQIDHIDGDSSNCNLSNLRILCPNCHSLTPTFGALNKGRGRKMRHATVV